MITDEDRLPLGIGGEVLADYRDTLEGGDEFSQEAAEERAKAEAAAKAAIADALGHRLQAEFERRKGQRAEIERRWLDDIERYNAVYSRDEAAALKERKFSSKLFMPLTRRICNIVEARLGDLLFPTDDRNFVVSSSPMPELADMQSLAKQLPAEAPIGADGQPVQAGAVAMAVQEIRDEAKRRASNMQRAVDDQLKESNYPTEARKVIHDAIKIGTGVVKGPFVFGRMKKQWLPQPDGSVQLNMKEDLSAKAVRVDPWNFYPDLSVGDILEGDGDYERHKLTKARLAELAKQPGFNEDAIRDVLMAGSVGRDNNTDAQREAAGTVGVDDTRFNLIEFNGSVDAEELAACGCDIPDDPLMAYNAVVWFSEFTGKVVKAIISPLDTGERPYAVFNWQRDTQCVFGYGVPYELRDTQDAANAIFRGCMDNGGLMIGPQIVVNSKRIRPMNNNWTMEPMKLWDLLDSATPVENAFGFFQVDSRINELLSLWKMVKDLADEIGGPQMAMQGTEAPSYVQAGATGAALAFNAANVWMRRAVKQWDDQVTVPVVTRFVDWNMQHNPDPEVKGDFHTIARGTSALMEAEGQVTRIQALMAMSAQAGVPIRKVVNQLRQMALAMRLDPDELLPDDEEVRAMEEQAKKNGPPPNPEMERIAMRKMEIENNDKQRAHEAAMRQQENEIRWAEIAAKSEMSAAEAQARFLIDRTKVAATIEDRREQRAHDAQKFNAEMTLAATKGEGI